MSIVNEPTNVENTDNSNPQLWFAVQVRSKAERSVAAIARYNRFEEFLPLYRSGGRWFGRAKSADVPLFPGYVFCRINPEMRLQLQTIPGVRNIVGDGKKPTPVIDAEIASLQAAAQSGLPLAPWPFANTGARVILKRGPLAGLEGRMVALRNSCRFLLPVSILNCFVSVEIERDWATPVLSPRPRGAANAFTQPLAE